MKLITAMFRFNLASSDLVSLVLEEVHISRSEIEVKSVIKLSSKQSNNHPSKRRVLLAISAFTFTIMVGLITLPIAAPETGSDLADALRSVIGPEPVSALESAVFRVQDILNSAQYQVTGQVQEVAWDSPAQRSVPLNDNPKSTPVNNGRSIQGPDTGAKPDLTQPVITKTPSITNNINVPTQTQVLETSVTDGPPMLDGGWQAFGSTAASGLPIMARGIVQPDPSRPFVRTAVIRMDLRQAQLHLVAGTKEPKLSAGITPFARPGIIPSTDASPNTLLAAFNGGFKAEHGRYGMIVNQKIILPPRDGIATIALYRDGHIQIGAWGQEITQTQDLSAFRQNCTLLVQKGQVTPNIDNTDLLSWGFTGVGSPSATWRSGLGLSQDGRFLIYVVGKSLTAQTLAVALQQAGTYYGMQLDINGAYTRFATYVASGVPNSGFPVQAELLLKDMRGSGTQYLEPSKRDFFYVTLLNK